MAYYCQLFIQISVDLKKVLLCDLGIAKLKEASELTIKSMIHQATLLPATKSRSVSCEFEATLLRATLLPGIERRSIPGNNVAWNIKEKPPLPRLRRYAGDGGCIQHVDDRESSLAYLALRGKALLVRNYKQGLL